MMLESNGVSITVTLNLRSRSNLRDSLACLAKMSLPLAQAETEIALGPTRAAYG